MYSFIRFIALHLHLHVVSLLLLLYIDCYYSLSVFYYMCCLIDSIRFVIDDCVCRTIMNRIELTRFSINSFCCCCSFILLLFTHYNASKSYLIDAWFFSQDIGILIIIGCGGTHPMKVLEEIGINGHKFERVGIIIQGINDIILNIRPVR